MPETAEAPPSTSDRVRRDPPTGPDFGEMAQKVTPAPQPDPRAALNEKIATGLDEQAASVNPKLKAAQEMGERLVREAEEKRKTMGQGAADVKAVQAQQPSLGLRPFLSTVKGEAPEVAIQKFIQALGLFGTAIGGNARGDARAGLAALTGAMQGWQQGDRERADRAFADWRTKMDAALQASEEERRNYREWFTSGKFSLDQAFKGAELEAMMRGNDRAADLFRKGNMDQNVAEMLQWQTHEDNLRMQYLRIKEMHADKEAQRNMTMAIASMKAQQKQDESAKVNESFTPEVIQTLGQQWATTGKMPAGMGRSGAQAAVRAKIVAAGLEWARGNNVDPTALPAIQAEGAAASGAMKDASRRRSVAAVAVGTFDRHMAQLVELSGKVDRSDRPVIARYQLQIKGQYDGDVDTAAFQAMALEAAQEFAKIAVGTAQGDQNTRDEARKVINTALNPKQLVAVADNLKRAAHSRMTQYDETIKEQADLLKSLGAKGTPEPPKQGKIRVRRKADGQTGTIDAKDMSSAYEMVQ